MDQVTKAGNDYEIDLGEAVREEMNWMHKNQDV